VQVRVDLDRVGSALIPGIHSLPEVIRDASAIRRLATSRSEGGLVEVGDEHLGSGHQGEPLLLCGRHRSGDWHSDGVRRGQATDSMAQ
jgi:hypothetical protein